jgi:ribosomal protein L29
VELRGIARVLTVIAQEAGKEDRYGRSIG